jgi:hypothetical protein
MVLSGVSWPTFVSGPTHDGLDHAEPSGGQRGKAHVFAIFSLAKRKKN